MFITAQVITNTTIQVLYLLVNCSIKSLLWLLDIVCVNTGQIIDGPHNGPAPGPWLVDVKPARMFSPSTTHVEVPHTASVKV